MTTWNDLAPRVITSLSRDLNLTPEQAAGIVGQLGYESNGLQAINEQNPTVPGSRGGFGWAQWTGPRRQAFETWAANKGMNVSDPNANYGFLVSELQNGPESGVLSELRNAKTAQDAGRIFTDQFLRPGVPNYSQRQLWTQKALNFLIPTAAADTLPQTEQGPWTRYAPAAAATPPSEGPWARFQSSRDASAPSTTSTPLAQPQDVKMPPGFTPINQDSGPIPNAPQPNPGDGGVLAGIEMGLRDPIDAGAQMLRRAVPDSVGNAVDEFGNYLHDLGLPVAQSNGVQGVDNLVNQANAKYEAARAAAGRDGFDFARLGGNVLGTLPMLAATPEALATRLGTMGTGLAQGAALGALQPVVGSLAQSDFGSNKASQVALGAALGGVLPAVNRVVSPLASRVGSEAQKLLGEGVQLTPGQALGGALMRMEDRAMSVPILGDAIRSARQRGNESLNRAVYNRVLSPIGQSTSKIGREAVSDARQKISQAYDDALKNVQFTPDNAFAQSITNLRSMAQSLPARERRAFENVLQREVIEPLSKGRAIDGQAFKDIETNLGNQAAKFKGSTDAYQKDLGDAIGEVQRALRENLERMNPQYAQKLRNANTAFANFVRLEKAAGAIGAHDGVFTPQQLARAIQQTDRSVRKGAYSRGDALMQDLSDAAQSRMSAQIPDSGTAGRLMNTAALGSYFVNPAIPAGLAASAVPYLPGISRAVVGAIARRPASAAALAQGLNRLPPGMFGVLGNQSQ